ncbi:hypothetical protein RRG08_031782 [Elysia crispata]|uniref:Uncharacterized protein n=1 Tax=Elysia crispata TaxID=231223 RepID=A0AAE1ANE4_9GAST|nr:hypothetical protein RRG08_031782 [Elysia crispata]
MHGGSHCYIKFCNDCSIVITVVLELEQDNFTVHNASPNYCGTEEYETDQRKRQRDNLSSQKKTAIKKKRRRPIQTEMRSRSFGSQFFI